MAQDPRPPAREEYYTVSAVAGSCLLECFVAARAFRAAADAPQIAFTEEHYHSSYELLLCRSDTGFAFINGVGHRYEENTVFLLAPYVNHASISSREQLRGWYSVRFELLGPVRPQQPRDPVLERALEQLRREGFFSLRAEPELLSLADMLARAVRTTEPDAPLLLSGLLSAVFSWVFRAMRRSQGGDQGSRAAWSADGAARRRFLVDYYFDHLMYSGEDTEKKLEDLGRELHLSPSQLNRVLRETYGTSFQKRKIEVRLAYIRYYLKCSDLSVSEIARRTNFASDSSFSLFFKQHCGMSPTEYRRREAAALAELRREL